MEQRQRVLEYMTEHGSISSPEMMRMGIKDPSMVITRLRQQGYRIITEIMVVRNKNHKETQYAVYKMEDMQ